MFTGIINDIGEVFKIGEKKGDKKFFISTNEESFIARVHTEMVNSFL